MKQWKSTTKKLRLREDFSDSFFVFFVSSWLISVEYNLSSQFLSKLRWKLTLPEYLLRPAQIIRRVKRKMSTPKPIETARLPWGLDLQIMPPEMIFNSIWYKGVFDVVASEVIWRLLDEGETCVDVGAHVGYLTSLMAARVGSKGRVISCEPHPVLFRLLKENVEHWARHNHVAEVRPFNIALSDENGVKPLYFPPHWENNRGVASLAREHNKINEGSVPVTVRRIDDFLDEEGARPKLIKIDVEFHEYFVLRGAEKLLESRGARDIIFEDFDSYPTRTMLLLESHGYTIFSLAKRFRGPRACGKDRSGASPRDDPNYLATLEPERAERRLKKKGWSVLRER